MNIHFADLGIILILLFFLVRGYAAGFILSVITILVLIVSLFLATLYANEFSTLLLQWLFFLPDSTIQVVSFAILFILIFTILNWLSKLTKILNKLPLIGNLNQGFGALFGLFKGMIVLSLVLIAVKFQSDKDSTIQSYLEEGKLYHYFNGIAPAVYDAVTSIIPVGGDFYTEFNTVVKEEVDKKIDSFKESQ